MKPGIMAGIVVTILVIVGAFLFIASDDDKDIVDSNNSNSQQTATTPTETSDPSDTASENNEQLLKASEVSAHDSKNDCWTIVGGSVYDITAYVPRHPGGDEILRACGADGTSLFNSRTTDDGEKVGSGTPHSTNAANQLADFKVGTLDTTAE